MPMIFFTNGPSLGGQDALDYEKAKSRGLSHEEALREVFKLSPMPTYVAKPYVAPKKSVLDRLWDSFW